MTQLQQNTWKPTKSPNVWTLRLNDHTVVVTLTTFGTLWNIYRKGKIGPVADGGSSALRDFAAAEFVLAAAQATPLNTKRPCLLTHVPTGRRKYVQLFLKLKGYDVKLSRMPINLGHSDDPTVQATAKHIRTIAPGSVIG